jgi:hypothetical protein
MGKRDTSLGGISGRDFVDLLGLQLDPPDPVPSPIRHYLDLSVRLALQHLAVVLAQEHKLAAIVLLQKA